MGENENLIGVLGEIDRAVEAHPERRFDVANALPAYRDRSVVGWFASFESWVRHRTSDHPAFPTVDQAVEALSRQPPPGRSAGGEPDLRARRRRRPRPADDLEPLDAGGHRRERSLAGLTAALPDRFGPQAAEHERVLDALRPATLDDSRDEAAARIRSAAAGSSTRRVSPVTTTDGSRLLSRHADVITVTSGSRLVSRGPRGGDRDPVSVLTTEAELHGHTVDRVDRLLQPARWKDLYGELWEGMTPVDGVEEVLLHDGERRCFREAFRVTPTFTLRPVLQVVRRPLSSPDRAPSHRARALEYRLCTQHRHQDPDGLTHDAGAIVTRELNGRLTVTTSKRVAFDGPFNGAALVMVADALGYPAAFEDMVRRALALSSEAGRR